MKKQKLENIKQSGFKVPKNYFESFDDLLLNELKLKEACKNHGFKVPNNYFNSVENNILNSIKETEKPKVIKLITWQKLSYIAAVAASLIIMFNVIVDKGTFDMNKIETASIENYILNEELDTNDMATLFKEVDISSMSLTNNNISSETLETYVLDNLEIDELLINKK
jgi:hypothetical protein